MKILKEIAKALLSALLTEKFIKEVVIFLLSKLAEKTDNKIDDVLVKKVAEALRKES